jgi:hypothetical protein
MEAKETTTDIGPTAFVTKAFTEGLKAQVKAIRVL